MVSSSGPGTRPGLAGIRSSTWAMEVPARRPPQARRADHLLRGPREPQAGPSRLVAGAWPALAADEHHPDGGRYIWAADAAGRLRAAAELGGVRGRVGHRKRVRGTAVGARGCSGASGRGGGASRSGASRSGASRSGGELVVGRGAVVVAAGGSPASVAGHAAGAAVGGAAGDGGANARRSIRRGRAAGVEGCAAGARAVPGARAVGDHRAGLGRWNALSSVTRVSSDTDGAPADLRSAPPAALEPPGGGVEDAARGQSFQGAADASGAAQASATAPGGAGGPRPTPAQKCVVASSGTSSAGGAGPRLVVKWQGGVKFM